MPTRFDRLRHGADGPDVATYKALRAAGQSWFAKIMRHPAGKGFDIVKAAKKLMLSVLGRKFGLPVPPSPLPSPVPSPSATPPTLVSGSLCR